MEALAIAGTILGILDVATRCTSFLIDLGQRYQEVDLTILLLCGQLNSVKAALRQIHYFTETWTEHDHHYQLTLDIDVAVNCCNLLIRVLDEQITKLKLNDTGDLAYLSKIKLVLESKGMEECFGRLDRQINALTLIITAFKEWSVKGEQDVLTDDHSRVVLDRVKEDSVSLIVLCDADSFATERTHTTTNTSKLSVNFDFDAELLQAKAYKYTLRSLMRRAANLPPLPKAAVGLSKQREAEFQHFPNSMHSYDERHDRWIVY